VYSFWRTHTHTLALSFSFYLFLEYMRPIHSLSGVHTHSLSLSFSFYPIYSLSGAYWARTNGKYSTGVYTSVHYRSRPLTEIIEESSFLRLSSPLASGFLAANILLKFVASAPSATVSCV
jgi:hypothetical protein